VTWFEQLMGFRERDHAHVQDSIRLDGNTMRSLVNGKSYVWGSLSIPSLAEMRRQVEPLLQGESDPTSLREIVGDVRHLHCDPTNRDAVFQVASQFNLLEMVGPSVTPERGVGGYENDHTQGPACAVAAGAGTIYRNYFVEVDGKRGQTAKRQVDCLADLGTALGNRAEALWTMRNGYALATSEGLEQINGQLATLGDREKEQLTGQLKVGIQRQTEVTLPHEGAAPLLVSQVYGSALPVAYSEQSAEQWELLARLVLEASYEATFAAAVLNQQQTGNNKLYLTLLGGGAFGNRTDWILHAIRRGMGRFRHAGLEVAIVSYGRSHPEVQRLIRELR